jgi:hypothetical protein
MGLLFQPPAALCHHDLDVATVTRVMLGDDVAEPGSSFQDWRPVATSDARATAQSLP